MSEKQKDSLAKTSYRLVRNGSDVELHQEMVFRFPPKDVEQLIEFLEQSLKWHDETSGASGGSETYYFDLGPRDMIYEDPTPVETHFLSIQYSSYDHEKEDSATENYEKLGINKYDKVMSIPWERLPNLLRLLKEQAAKQK